MVALTVSLVLLSQTPDALLGGPGESCRARADCQSGLKCLNAVCTAPAPVTKEGQACEATSECSTDGSLRCIARVCSKPGTRPSAVMVQPAPAPAPAPVPAPAPSQGWSAAPPPPSYQPPPSSSGESQTADELIAQAIEAEVRPFDKNAFFIGGTVTGAVMNVVGGIGPDVRFGWFFKRTQLSFELGGLYYPGYASGSLSGRASVGYSVPFIERGDFAFFWGPKAGAMVLAGAVTGVGVHADLISFGIRTGHWFFDLQLPSVGFLFGTTAYIPVQGRFTVAYTF